MEHIGKSTTAGSLDQTPSTVTSLINAVERLKVVTNGSLDTAVRLTGGWPESGASTKAPEGSGIFDAMDRLAADIHLICDRLNDADQAIARRL